MQCCFCIEIIGSFRQNYPQKMSKLKVASTLYNLYINMNVKLLIHYSSKLKKNSQYQYHKNQPTLVLFARIVLRVPRPRIFGSSSFSSGFSSSSSSSSPSCQHGLRYIPDKSKQKFHRQNLGLTGGVLAEQ